MYNLIVVDDEASIRHGLSLIDWNALGFSLSASLSDGDEALQYLVENAADVVLTDIVMPRVSGLDVAKWVYQNRPETFVVLLSGYSDFKNAQEAIAFRVVRYLLKPTDPDELCALFQELKTLLDERGAPVVREELAAGSGDFNLLISVNEYLENHLSESTSLSKLAKHLYLSPSYLSHLFRSQADTTYSKYVTGFRLEKARRMLRGSNAKVRDISLAVGYRDVRYFLRIFHDAYGMSPTAYRRTLVAKTASQPPEGRRE